jgi:hypothetical protein
MKNEWWEVFTLPYDAGSVRGSYSLTLIIAYHPSFYERTVVGGSAFEGSERAKYLESALVHLGAFLVSTNV